MNLTEILNRDRFEAILAQFPKTMTRFLKDPLLRKERAPDSCAPASLEQLGTGLVFLSLISVIASGVQLFTAPDLSLFVFNALFTPLAIAITAILSFIAVVVLGF